MKTEAALFVSTFATLLAIINPLEVLPVYLGLVSGQEERTQRIVALKASVYALGLCFFFLIFGNIILRVFNVPMSMVRIAGGIILMKIGFDLFSPSASRGKSLHASGVDLNNNIAFVPLAMPLMCGPGAIATILGMTSTIKNSRAEVFSLIAVSVAILAAMLATYLLLAYAPKLTKKIGPMAIDATTRIVGFFVSAMGVGLVFDGVIEALELHGITSLH
jgi:multiple antibiotic resistance protein